MNFSKVSGIITAAIILSGTLYSCLPENEDTPPSGAPEMSISAGAEIPSGSGELDLGSLAAGSTGPATLVYIENTGTAGLELAGTPPVAISGTDPGQFSIDEMPASEIPAGESSWFSIVFLRTAPEQKPLWLPSQTTTAMKIPMFLTSAAQRSAEPVQQEISK